jgi:hypothetical protein
LANLLNESTYRRPPLFDPTRPTGADIDYWGNALGEFFGVIGPKYQDEIDEAKRRGEEVSRTDGLDSTKGPSGWKP